MTPKLKPSQVRNVAASLRAPRLIAVDEAGADPEVVRARRASARVGALIRAYQGTIDAAKGRLAS